MKCRLSTVFHSQTDKQTEYQNQILKHYIRCYCLDKQDNWANLLSLTEFAYQNRMQTLIECSLFYAMHNYHLTIHYIENDSRKEKMSAVKEQIKWIHKIRKVLTQWWENIVAAQIKYYDKKHKLQSYRVEDLVMLLIRNLQQKCLSQKLSHKFIELFRVQNLVEKQIYQLSLSIIYWIYDVFHVFYLKLYQHWWDNSFTQILQSLKLIDDIEKYKVEKIQDKKKTKEEIWYKIR